MQYPGEFIITFSNGYHTGFNSGFNTNEAVNFVNESWLEELPKQRYCKCQSNNVKINMFHFYFNLLQSDYDYENNYYFQNFKQILIKKNALEIQRIHNIIYESKVCNRSDDSDKNIVIKTKKKKSVKNKKKQKLTKSANQSKKETPLKNSIKSCSVSKIKTKKIAKSRVYNKAS